jgi:hypothetical protein
MLSVAKPLPGDLLDFLGRLIALFHLEAGYRGFHAFTGKLIIRLRCWDTQQGLSWQRVGRRRGLPVEL